VIGARLAEDSAHRIKAVAVVHNETSTGVASDIAAVRRAIDEARHPALLAANANARTRRGACIAGREHAPS